MYENYKVLGPYKRKTDNRWFVVLKDKNGAKTTKTYANYLYELKLGRKLIGDESIHHIDGDQDNNNIENLELVLRSEHTKLHAKRLVTKKFICPWCSKEFELNRTKLSNAITNRKRGKAGPFCSRSCAGKYGAAVQNGKISKLKVSLINQEYYKLS